MKETVQQLRIFKEFFTLCSNITVTTKHGVQGKYIAAELQARFERNVVKVCDWDLT